MASLIEQMEYLQKQQAILAEKIKEEAERNEKLAHDASIERLEALIQPISECLDWICPNQNGVSYSGGSRSDWSTRRNLNSKFEIQMRERQSRLDTKWSRPITKYQSSHMLANEEIFVTLLNIIKKQEARICDLEATVLEY